MKQLIAFIGKEFRHIFRDSRTLLVIMGMPIVQILLFGFAINTEVQDIRVMVYTPTPDNFTEELTEHIRHNPYFLFQGRSLSIQEIEETLRQGKLDLAIVFQPDFRETLMSAGKADIQLITDSSDPNRGAIATTYASAIIRSFHQEKMRIKEIPYQINTETRMIYNPQMKSAYMFVPGVMGLVLMIISTIMTSVSIVREKEQGTMEVLLASPLSLVTMIIAKSIPYLVISFANLISILLLSYFVLQVPINGSLILLLLISLLYIFLSLSFGLMISSMVNKQFNAVIISAMTVMIPTLMLSGMIFPISNMPPILRLFSHLIPARWFIAAVKKVMIQGQGAILIWKELLILSGMVLCLMAITIMKTKKRLD